MKISNKALDFAIRAFEGQKGTKDYSNVLQSMITGDILRSYAFNSDVEAAGYLYNIEKETTFTNYDIARIFGGKVSSLLMTAIEPNGNISWKDAKKQQIKAIKNLPNDNRVIIAASLIAELENKRINSYSSEITDYDNQFWYYRAMLEALEEDFEHPIFERLYQNILAIFYYGNLSLEPAKPNVKIHSQKTELNNLRSLLESQRPYIIEFTSSKKPEFGLKSVLNDFFKNPGIKIKVNEQRPITNRFEQEYIYDVNGMSSIELNFLVSAEIEAGLLSEVAGGETILLISQGLFKRLIWLKRFIDCRKISKSSYDEYILYYLNDLEKIINYVAINYTLDSFGTKKYDKATKKIIKLLNGEAVLADEHLKGDTVYRVFDHLVPMMSDECINEVKKFIKTREDKSQVIMDKAS